MIASPIRAAAAAVALLGLLGACARTSASASAVEAPNDSILVGSTPAAGSTVSAPVNELVLNFDPPARLLEITVTGPEGAMPTMITPAGEQLTYSVPLPGLGPGSYRVDWRASAAGHTHQGSFGFAVN